MKNKFSFFFVVALIALLLGSCKFYFNESEYLGTYVGSFNSQTSLYEDCSGHLNVIDAGDNIVNLELISDSNPTFYYYGLKVERGFSLGSDNLRINSGDIDVYMNRNNHSLTFRSYYSSSSYDFNFEGDRQ